MNHSRFELVVKMIHVPALDSSFGRGYEASPIPDAESTSSPADQVLDWISNLSAGDLRNVSGGVKRSFFGTLPAQWTLTP